jgi:hypothetical protein
LDNVWSVFGYHNMNKKVFHVRFKDNGDAETFKFDKIFDFDENNFLEKLKWKRIDDETIQILS